MRKLIACLALFATSAWGDATFQNENVLVHFTDKPCLVEQVKGFLASRTDMEAFSATIEVFAEGPYKGQILAACWVALQDRVAVVDLNGKGMIIPFAFLRKVSSI